jgi:hypothetical protein
MYMGMPSDKTVQDLLDMWSGPYACTERDILRALRALPGVRFAWLNQDAGVARVHASWNQIAAGAGVSPSWALRDLLDRVIAAGVDWSATLYPEDGGPTVSLAKLGAHQVIVRIANPLESLLYRVGELERVPARRLSLWQRLTWWRHPPRRVVDVDHVGNRALLHEQRWSWSRWGWRDAQ